MVALESIVEKGFLRRIHKDVRQAVRSNHLPQALLLKDPTLLSDFQFELDDALRLLKHDVLHGDYRPRKVTIIGGAKATGLRRPLAFLQHEDALLLAALTRAARTGIARTMPQWVSFGRSEERSGKQGKEIALGLLEPESTNWFYEWMQYRGLLRLIEDDPRKYLVISDVADFFPRLDLEILRDCFSREGFLDQTGTNLLFFLLEQLLERMHYAPRSKLGLPQDPYDACRILAHFYLSSLDEELRREGSTGRYTRWVDDIAVSVENRLEGALVISRIQDALRRVGLSPNSQKTRIVTKEEFREEHLEDYNGLLNVAQRRADMGMVNDRFRRTFDEWLLRFLSGERKGRWERVLRRFYTQSRRVGNGRLAALALTHLSEMPSEASHILDYLCYRPARENARLVEGVFKFLREDGSLYEDAQILCYEWLLAAPFDDDRLLRFKVVRQSYRHFLAKPGYARPGDYVRGLIGFVVLKFGGPRALGPFCESFLREAESQRALAVNGLYVLSADSAMYAKARSAVEHLRDTQVSRLQRYLAAVEDGVPKAVGIGLGMVSVSETDLPRRLVFRARSLPLLYLLRRTPAVATQLSLVQAENAKRLSTQADHRLRDLVMESHF